MLIFLGCLLITIIMHELGHMLVALKCGVKVEAFSIGFGKPYLHKKFKGIDFRLTPWLIGGYCQLKGENSKLCKDDFLNQTYRKKFIILIAGVTINFLIACICYLINYKSISVGIKLDMLLLNSIFTQDYNQALTQLAVLKPNWFLFQLGLINILCAIGNILPIVPLDGGLLWYVIIENKLSAFWKKFIMYSGNFIVYVAQIILLIWMLL